MTFLSWAMAFDDWAELISGEETRMCYMFGVHTYRRVPTESEVASTLSMNGEDGGVAMSDVLSDGAAMSDGTADL